MDGTYILVFIRKNYHSVDSSFYNILIKSWPLLPKNPKQNKKENNKSPFLLLTPNPWPSNTYPWLFPPLLPEFVSWDTGILEAVSRKQHFIVPAQTQQTHVQRLSPKNKGVSPYIPLQAGYRSKKQGLIHRWIYLILLATLPWCYATFPSLVLCDLPHA
jgi:hypothetical protein